MPDPNNLSELREWCREQAALHGKWALSGDSAFPPDRDEQESKAKIFTALAALCEQREGDKALAQDCRRCIYALRMDDPNEDGLVINALIAVADRLEGKA